MAFAPAFDSLSDPSRDGTVLTFVLPANQCNLNCAHCIIRQRKEADENKLNINDYLSFIKYGSTHFKISHIALQGYEPLLPESWPFTEAIISYAHKYKIDISLITNGIFLDCYMEKLLAYKINKISVSLDSSSSEWHDLKRGTNGAFDLTLRSLNSVVKLYDFSHSLWVNTVLYPDGLNMVMEMPQFLRSIGIDNWSVSPLLKIGKSGKEGNVEFTYIELQSILLDLHRLASLYNITLRFDDEFGFFGDKWTKLPFSVYRTIERIDNFIRLTPSGACSIGREILNAVDQNTSIWNPEMESANEFIQRLANKTQYICC